MMKKVGKLALIGFIAGLVLIAVMKVIQWVTGSPAYVLLFNFDYIPVVNSWEPVWLVGLAFHTLTCVASAVVLYYLLRPFGMEKQILPYVAVYSIGGGLLFSLTALSEQPPDFSDGEAWIWWTLGHAVFGWVVGGLIRRWI